MSDVAAFCQKKEIQARLEGGSEECGGMEGEGGWLKRRAEGRKGVDAEYPASECY